MKYSCVNFRGVLRRGKSAFRKAVSAVFFPDSCAVCGGVAYGKPLCGKCRESLLKEAAQNCNERRCEACGKRLLSEEGMCMQCRAEEAPSKKLDGIRPVFPYLLRKKKLLYVWKITGKKSLTPFFAECVEKVYTHDFRGLPVVPVPPRPGKIRSNGWDQTDSLTKEFCAKNKVKALHLLLRTSGQQQKKLGRRERLSGSGQYVASKRLIEMKDEDKPRHVVLIDDVMTTGSTLFRCASVLKKYGIEKVSAMTLFNVPS